MMENAGSLQEYCLMLFDILSTESQVRANSILVFFQQIQFWCVFFHISQAQEEEGDREEEIEKF